MLYTLALSFVYIIQIVISYFVIRQNNEKKIAKDHKHYINSDNLLPISIIVPAFNEEENIIENIYWMLNIEYPEHEVIIINDGSTDNTHSKIVAGYKLKQINPPIKISLKTKQIRAVYFNPQYPNLIYVDKEPGGKSDALNTGINISKYPLFVCLDADSMIERDAILKISTEFLKDTKTVVAGGFVRIANGSVIENGKWKRFKMPNLTIERFQIIEYFRAFLSGRVSWNSTNSLLIVSGAFGVFNKSIVIEAGGYKTDTIGEDMEIIVTLHQYLRNKKRKYTIKFIEDAVCWTQGPMSVHDIRTQRRRWQIGLMDSLLHHKSMVLNPKYGSVGLLSLPYAWIFEFFGALVEGFGYFVIPLAFLFNELSLFFFLLYLAVSTLLGILISLGGLILEQNTNRGAMTVKQCMQLTPYAMLENFGYRQFITLCRVEGILRYHGLKSTWSKVKREPFNQ
jgi:cellulose synthase/poly-beta-1,6-N-acetylglucosamine synthase-like glycosyltransferase